jgi:hypothetical protein
VLSTERGRVRLSAGQKVDQFLARESRFPQQGHQSSSRQVAIVTGNHCSASGRCMEEDEVAARTVVQYESALLEKTDDLALSDGR